MESIFTYNPDPPKVSSPWSTPGGRVSPLPTEKVDISSQSIEKSSSASLPSPVHISETGITRLEAEPQQGSTEYKLHLLLRSRRAFSWISTANQASGSQHPTSKHFRAGTRFTASSPPVRSASPQSRQTRLQQLTTQLLWRLQQSSPFHSCSTAGLVLPTLPEATPKLWLPSKPARLLPGLEESQGALYEVGVSDDGTFVGLIGEELEESLTNLKAMAASLGCVVEVLRKVVVGRCQLHDSEHSPGSNDSAKAIVERLWVAEALVRPDLGNPFQPPSNASLLGKDALRQDRSESDTITSLSDNSRPCVEQLRISIVGATSSGKSSLLGTLTTSLLDNGRGKSRLNLLKHRHEIASGITSSVSQELIGYRKRITRQTFEQPASNLADIINYASENVSSWNDIHASAARLTFLSDSPGLPRYLKSAIRALMSWRPHWILLCVAANLGADDASRSSTPSTLPMTSTAKSSDQPSVIESPELSFMHLDLCLKLGLPVMVVVTKMDIATKYHLRQTLSRLLSTLKSAARKPALIPAPDSPNLDDQATDLQSIGLADQARVDSAMRIVDENGMKVVPIVLTSAMTGQGLGTLHGFLRSMPITNDAGVPSTGDSGPAGEQNSALKVFQIDEVFAMLPSKVYSSSRQVSDFDRGIVLCGFVSSGSIGIGDTLKLGPFLIEKDEKNGLSNHLIDRATSFPNLVLQETPARQTYARSTPTIEMPAENRTYRPSATVAWQSVRVVSLRNLRLSARCLVAGQVGTVGLEPVRSPSSAGCDLRGARKGMVLALCEDGEPLAFRTFTASFPAREFETRDSPPLILGGHTTVYINSIRATAVVASVTFAEDGDNIEPSPKDDGGIFGFEHDGSGFEGDRNIKITFRFLRSVEWMQLDDHVLVVPNTYIATTTAGGAVGALGVGGFVGKVCELPI